MSLIPVTYLVDPSGQQWAVGCTNQAVLTTTPVFGQFAVPYVYLNDVSAGASWQLAVATGGILTTTNTVQGDYPTQLLVTAPNGVVYGIQIATVGPPALGSVANGILQTALPVDTSSYTCTTPISDLASNVLERLEENYPGGPVFWNESFEVYTAIVEAENDLLLLVGRPTQTVSMPFNLTPNSVWQTVPKGVFLISDIQGPQAPLHKYTLSSYDYEQPGSIGSDWENDTSPSGPTSWAPVGMTMFVVHPACTSPQTVLISGLAYPVAETNFPYSGSETVPFHDEADVWLEMYAAHILRLKESGPEFQESLVLYQGYLQGAKRLTELENRKDPLIFAPPYGAPVGVNSHTRR
jgi:hypothetical protein